MAHAEGKYFADDETLARLEDEGRVVFRYTDRNGDITSRSNPNGSANHIAGIQNEAGNVLGMMPHPERAVEPILGSTDGLGIFTSMMKNLATAGCVMTHSTSEALAGQATQTPKHPPPGTAIRPSPPRSWPITACRRTNTSVSFASWAGSPPSPSSACSAPCGPSTAGTRTRSGCSSSCPPRRPGSSRGPARTPESSRSTIPGPWPSRSNPTNHPSAVEPYQGAATGVGGILRDIFTMGARPVAVLDSLRFGDLDSGRVRYLFNGVVRGRGRLRKLRGCAQHRRRGVLRPRLRGQSHRQRHVPRSDEERRPGSRAWPPAWATPSWP